MALHVLNRLESKLHGNINALSNSVLEKLLRWMGIPVSKMGKRANRKKVLYTCKLWMRVGTSMVLVRHGPMPTRKSSKLLKTIPSKWETPLTLD